MYGQRERQHEPGEFMGLEPKSLMLGNRSLHERRPPNQPSHTPITQLGFNAPTMLPRMKLPSSPSHFSNHRNSPEREPSIQFQRFPARNRQSHVLLNIPSSHTNPTNLSYHDNRISTLIEPNVLAERKPVKCPECQQIIQRQHDLKRHRKIHLGVKPFTCGYCRKSFGRQDSLKVLHPLAWC
jgi:uncharacterized Zn-finger protein